jgi:hypothetical protein
MYSCMRLNDSEFGLEQGYVGEAIVICLFLEAILLADEFKRQPRRSRFVKMGRHLVHRRLSATSPTTERKRYQTFVGQASVTVK